MVRSRPEPPLKINNLAMKNLALKIGITGLLFFLFAPIACLDDYSPPRVHKIFFTYDGEPYEKYVKYSISCYYSNTVNYDQKYFDEMPREFYASGTCPSYGCKAILGNSKSRRIVNYCNIIGSSEDGYFLIENADPAFLHCGDGTGSVRASRSERIYGPADLVFDCDKEFQVDRCLDELKDITSEKYDYDNSDFLYSMVDMCNVTISIPYDSFTQEKPEPTIIVDEPTDNDKDAIQGYQEWEKKQNGDQTSESAKDEEVDEAAKSAEDNANTEVSDVDMTPYYMEPYYEDAVEDDAGSLSIGGITVDKDIIIYVLLAAIGALFIVTLFLIRRK